MAVTLLFPTSAELMEIEREKLPRLTQDDPVFKMFPIVNRDFAKVQWEQKDNFLGLMQLRGLNGAPPNVKLLGGKRYEMTPGRYGEHVLIEEADIELRRQWGSYQAPIPVDDLTSEAQDRLLERRLDRMRWITWTLLSTGTFSVPGTTGGIVHTDTFPLQTQTAAVAWGTSATATPLVDLRAVKLKARGKSVRFDKSAMAFANTNTVNNLLKNTNSSDIGGKRLAQGATFNSLGDFNAIFTDNDLPNIVEYDEGYLNDSGTFVPFIADGLVVIIGKRTNGDTLGEFQLTRNASNENAAPGPYTYVIDSLQTGVPVPRTLRVDDGFNGGPAIFYPSAICILNAA